MENRKVKKARLLPLARIKAKYIFRQLSYFLANAKTIKTGDSNS